MIEGSSLHKVADGITRLVSAMKTVSADPAEEPMLNALASFANGTWTVLVFPRRKHRPEEFFRTGDEQVMISPAIIDIGGLIVAPVKKDFQNVDATLVQKIYDEVLWEREALESVIAKWERL